MRRDIVHSAASEKCIPAHRMICPSREGNRVKRKRRGIGCMIGFSVLLIIVICGLVVLNSEWMQKKYGYGQDALATEKMIIDAYQRDPQGFDALADLLCAPGKTDALLYQASAGLFSIERNADLSAECLLLDDEWATAVASEMERLADWECVTISFLTDAADEETICAVDFTIRQHVSKVPWGKSYMDIYMRCYRDGRPEKDDDIRFSGVEGLSDRWVIVCLGLV